MDVCAFGSCFFFRKESRETGEGCQRMWEKKKNTDLCALPPHLDQSKSPTRAPHILLYETACPLLFPSVAEGDLTLPSPGDFSMRLLRFFFIKSNQKPKRLPVVFWLSPPLFFVTKSRRVWLMCVRVWMVLRALAECERVFVGASL